VGFGHRLTVVLDVGAERTRRKLELPLDELVFVFSDEKEADHHVDEELVVEVAEYGARALFSADSLEKVWELRVAREHVRERSREHPRPANLASPMTTLDKALLARAEAWLAEDPDPTTQRTLETWIRTSSQELADAFAGSLAFGTAGLRGLLGPGPNRMNRVVVARATAGLCTYLVRTVPNAKGRGIVIGYDGRRGSDVFAKDVADIAAGFGIRVLKWTRRSPTPFVAFAVKHHGAAAGVMITASHNPPDYNGYKVYWENGAQIIPPVDAGIASEIEKVGSYELISRTDTDFVDETKFVRLGAETEAAYYDGLAKMSLHPELPKDVRIAYTALHGVGARATLRGLHAAGFYDVHLVPEQMEPDGLFPTVAFPNPEEKGAMDLVLGLAAKVGAELVLANDPDADRLAVSVKARSGEYVTLTGNEIGQLFAHYLLSEDTRKGEKRVVACSVVSSPMLGSIAAHHGAFWEETLTGFKWIANRSLARAASDGARVVFGYEEALGYCVGELVRDKDGVSAAVLMAEIAAFCKAKRATILDELEVAARLYGLYLSRQISVTLPGADGLARIGRIMEDVRRDLPWAFAEAPVRDVADYGVGVRRDAAGHETRLEGESTNLIVFTLDGAHRVMLRPSGTEPKVKYYFDYRSELSAGETVADARARGDAALDRIVAAFRARVDAIV
jgi:phosphomannomutase